MLSKACQASTLPWTQVGQRVRPRKGHGLLLNRCWREQQLNARRMHVPWHRIQEQGHRATAWHPLLHTLLSNQQDGEHLSCIPRGTDAAASDLHALSSDGWLGYAHVPPRPPPFPGELLSLVDRHQLIGLAAVQTAALLGSAEAAPKPGWLAHPALDMASAEAAREPG